MLKDTLEMQERVVRYMSQTRDVARSDASHRGTDRPAGKLPRYRRIGRKEDPTRVRYF